MTELPEDLDGAPLPPELQRDGEVWTAIHGAVLGDAEVSDLDGLLERIAIALAPVLWPWLPQNVHSPIAERDRLIRAAIDRPACFTARTQTGSRPEPLWRWQARAVGMVLDDPDRARAAL